MSGEPHTFSDGTVTVIVTKSEGQLFLDITAETDIVEVSVLWDITDYSVDELRAKMNEPYIDFPYTENDEDADKMVTFTTEKIATQLAAAIEYIENKCLLD